jgi:mannobiose 2-epimerase
MRRLLVSMRLRNTSVQQAISVRLIRQLALYRLLEEYSYDSVEGGYLEAFDRDWTLLEDLRLSDKDANERKTMNTHLHVLEAYTNLYACWKNVQLRQQLKNSLRFFWTRFINKNNHLDLFFDESLGG